MRLLPKAGGQIEILAYAPDGSQLVASARPGPALWLWDLRTGTIQRLKQPRIPAPLAPPLPDNLLVPLAYSPSDGPLALGGERQLSLRNSGTGVEKFFRNVDSHQTGCLAFTPDGRTLVSTGTTEGRGEPQAAVYVWDVASGDGRKLPGRLPVRADPLAMTWDASLVLWREPPAPRGPSHLTLWHVPGRRPLARVGLSADPARAAFSPNGRQVALGVANMVLIYEIGHVLDYFGAALGSTPWGTLTLPLWWKSFSRRLPPLGSPKILEGHRGDVQALAYVADGTMLISAALDRTVRCWDLASLRPREELCWPIGVVTALAIAPDGMTAAAAGDGGRALIWDLTWF
jgi:WD40 repeat protein